MIKPLRVTLLVSLLSACGPTPTEVGPTEERPVYDTGSPAPPAEVGAEPPLGPDTGIVDAFADSTADTSTTDGGSADVVDAPVVDAPAPAWDSCEITSGGTVPIRIAKPVFSKYGARSLTQIGDRLLFLSSSGYSNTEITLAKTTPGAAAETLLMESDLWHLVTNGRDVVFGSAISMGRTDLVGSFPRYFGGAARGLAVDDYAAYYTRLGTAKDGSEGTLWRIPIGGSGAGTVIANGPMSSGLAIDASGLYVGSAYTPPFETPELSIVKVATDGTSVSLLATRIGFWDSFLALTPSHVVVLARGSGGTGALFTVQKSDGAVRTLTSLGTSSNPEVRIDSTYAYWIESKQIRRIALDGTKPVETVFTGACEPTSLTVDTESVYFLTSPIAAGKGNTTVWKMKKP